MHLFAEKKGELHCEDVPLSEIAEEHGTPVYVYSGGTLERHWSVFDGAFADVPHLICFSVKANPSLAILTRLARMGSGADIVSGGELYRALRAGVDPARIVYSGVGKRADEMVEALEAGILMFNIESFQELEALDAVAGRMGRTARIALRVNPDVDPGTHPHVATGLAASKFGIPADEAVEGYARAAALGHTEVVGIDCHIGSQLTEVGPFVEAVGRLVRLVGRLREAGHDIRYMDLGGGLGITYDAETPPLPDEYASAIRGALAGEDATLVLEPGRNLIGNVGVLLTRVLYTKRRGEKSFAIVDAGMSDLLRPALYDAHHGVVPVAPRGGESRVWDVVGPICESADFIGKDRRLPPLEPGDLVAVMSAGAYGFSMASTYNSRPLCAEVMVDGSDVTLVRERGTREDLVRGERA